MPSDACRASAAIGWRLLIVIAVVVCLALVGLLVADKSPIYWWMNTPAEPMHVNQSGYSPLTLTPLLGRAGMAPTAANATAKVSCNVLFSQHAHTRHSDGSMSPQQLLDWHAAHGYTAVAVTDHNTWSGGLAAVEAAKQNPNGPVALAGMEWSHCRGHYNLILPSQAARSLLFNGSHWVADPTVSERLRLRKGRGQSHQSILQPSSARGSVAIPLAKYPTDAQMKQAFDAVHSLGGIVVANHMPWSAWNLQRESLPTRAMLLNWTVDYVELVHEMYLDAQSLQMVEQNRIGALAGGDVHEPGEQAYGWSCLNATNPRDEESILSALRSSPRSVDILFNPEGTSEVMSHRDGTGMTSVGRAFAPLLWIGQYFQNFYSVTSTEGRLYGYSFVDGYCGAPEVYQARWPYIFWGIFWLAAAFIVYHVMLCSWAKCRNQDAVTVL